MFIRTISRYPFKTQPASPQFLFVIRRAIAFIVVLSFSYFTFEVAVADVHDGDASASEVAELAGNAPGAPILPSAPVDGATHDVHVCHCAHPHGGLTAGALILAHADAPTIAKLSLEVIAPDAVDLDHHLRPPIA